ASGSEVSTLIEGAEILKREKGLKIQVVSVISEALFREQPEDYRKKVIPEKLPVFGLTAGLPVTLENLAGPDGRVWGFESFGFSAPYKVLDEKLGFTGENVYQQVLKYLEER
ncbi:MAG: transketolase, partial [Bacteroidales bacterium]